MGAVDFLGNPMGLFNDVSSGLEGLVKRGNVGGLFMNVAHGVSDSAAKVSLKAVQYKSTPNNALPNLPFPFDNTPARYPFFGTRGFIFNKKTPSDYKLPLVMFGLQFILRVSAHTSCDD